MADFLMHSMSEFSDIFDKVLDIVKPKIIVEVGSEYGGSTKKLLKYAEANGSFLHVIDPSPYTDLELEFKGYEGFYLHHREKSVVQLELLPPADVYFLDGDHNYWTVSRELELIFRSNKNAWVLLHDVAFPWGRRDLYYSPGDIPREFIHEYTYKGGVDAENEFVSAGFGGEGHFAFAKRKGGARNGVLTAIEDFIAVTQGYHFSMITPIFGLGIIAPQRFAGDVEEILLPYKGSLIDRMEKNRLELYVQLLRLQADLDYVRVPLVKRIVRKLIGVFHEG